MATNRHNLGFNTGREPEFSPTILTSVLCSQVDIFLKRAVQHHTDIRKYQGTDVARFVNNVQISWETEQHNIDKLWKKYYPKRYSIEDEPAHQFTPWKAIENNPKIKEFNRASSINFQKEWVHLIDLVVQCLKRLNNAVDHWCNMFIGNWKACREHVYSLWREALAKESAQNASNPPGNQHHVEVAENVINAFFDQHKHLSSTGQGQRTLNKASRQDIVSEDNVQVQDTWHSFKRTAATSSKSTPRQDTATTPMPITKVDVKSKQQENLTSKYMSDQDRDIGACSPGQFSTTFVISRPPAVIDGLTQHQQQQQAPDIKYKENDNRDIVEENERLKQENQDLRNTCDKYKEVAWAWKHGYAENENRVEELEQKCIELEESATQYDKRLQNTTWEKDEEISRLNEHVMRLSKELKATQDEDVGLRNEAVSIEHAKDKRKVNSTGLDCAAQEWKEKYDNICKESERYKQKYEQLKHAATEKVNSLHTTIDQNDKEILRLNEQLTNSIRDIETKKLAIENLEKEVNSIKHTMQHQQVEKTTLMDQLSASMNREMSRDETDLENINVTNRPMKIMEEFELFCSQQWLDAKTALDENAEQARPDRPLDESDRCTLLCEVIRKSYAWVEDIYKRLQSKFTRDVERYATEPLLVLPDYHTKVPSVKTAIQNTEFELALTKILKNECNKADFTSISQSLLQKVFKDQVSRYELDKSLFQSSELSLYASTALSLCWRMRLQQPPMTLDCHSLLGECKIGDKAEPHYGSANPGDPTSMVQYYVYPAVLHGRTQMKKARVFLVSTSGPS